MTDLEQLADSLDDATFGELAFLAAIQHLPPRQRAVLILRDVVGSSARDTAAQLGSAAPTCSRRWASRRCSDDRACMRELRPHICPR
jgi:DNA-directed RNA polymerase specialized sigma24 family protein